VIETKPAAVPHYAFLDGLRAVLALYVVAHHSWSMVMNYNGRVSPYLHVLAHGSYAVCIFIVLSGFCLMLPTLKNDFRLARGAGVFFQRRAWRILPPYYFALALTLLLMGLAIGEKTGTLWDRSLPATWPNIVTHVLLVQNFIPKYVHGINYVFWSISLEWQIYFLFPLLLRGWRQVGPVWTTVAVVAVSFLMERGMDHFLKIDPGADFIGFFAMGMFAAYVSFSTAAAAVKFKAMPWRWLAVASFAGVVVLDRMERFGEANLAVSCFGACILMIASLEPRGWAHGLLSFRPLVVVGSFSYSLYLIHAPLLQLLWKYPFSPWKAEPNTMCLSLLLVGIPSIVLASYLFFLVGERPFLQARRRQGHGSQDGACDR